MRGFTLIELLAVLSTVASLAVVVGVIYVVVHFLTKLW